MLVSLLVLLLEICQQWMKVSLKIGNKISGLILFIMLVIIRMKIMLRFWGINFMDFGLEWSIDLSEGIFYFILMNNASKFMMNFEGKLGEEEQWW